MGLAFPLKEKGKSLAHLPSPNSWGMKKKRQQRRRRQKAKEEENTGRSPYLTHKQRRINDMENRAGSDYSMAHHQESEFTKEVSSGWDMSWMFAQILCEDG